MLPECPESVLLPLDSPLVAPHPFGRDWRPLQQRWLIPHQRVWAEEQAQLRRIEEQTGLTRQTLKSLQNGEYPVSAHTAFSISAARRSWEFLRFLAERVHMGLVPSRPLHAPPPGHFFRHFVVSHMKFFDLVIDHIEEGETLSDQDFADLQAEAEAMKQELDAWVQKAKEDREKARGK